jgi:hypothetical protein
MQIFKDLDPNSLDSDSRVIFKFTEYVESVARDSFYFLLRDGDYLLWALKDLMPAYDNYPEEWVGGTLLEFPVSGLQWFINTLEQRFFKKAGEGGLPKDKYAYEEELVGERLCVSRMFGTPGYAFKNFSRSNYVIKSFPSPQRADFSDELLFGKGLFEQLKLVAEKLERGEL